ncbi:WecB/TagA/CpsF family glycosyltransferase [Candidatus Berkelbacteria bacterium]|nr:WecB/TagA/CpsF family glycosyltransferase [Candidatus Berkelbacteria bacterium]
MNQSVPILGVEIDVLTFQEALNTILRWCHQAHHQTRQVATINPEFLMQGLHDREFSRVLNRADLRTADGMGIRFAGELLTQSSHRSRLAALLYTVVKALCTPDQLRPFPEVVTGSDLTVELFRRGANERLRIYLVGSEESIIDHLLIKLRGLYHTLVITGESAGKVSEDGIPEDGGLVERIAAFHPHLLLVAFGAPKQERFIARYAVELGAKVAIGIGGTFDYLTGIKPRAPHLVRRRGFEWFWRLCLEPFRWPRITTATYRFVRTVYLSS